MKKIKIISFMLLTILSCLKFASATEKNQSPIENAYEKTQNNQLEEEKQDKKEEEKLIENGASKKEILLENNANEEEILDKEANEEKILEKDANKKEILNKDADEEKKLNKNQKYTSDPTYNKLQKISKLAVQKAKKRLEFEDKKKNTTTDLIKQIYKQLTTINNLINNNKESLADDNNLMSDLEELQQNLLDFQEKINENSSVPKDLENLAKKAYDYIEKLGVHKDIIEKSKNDERIEDMYENFHNFASLNCYAKNHRYSDIANKINTVISGVYSEIKYLENCISEIYDEYYKIKNKSYEDQNKIYALKSIKSQIYVFKNILQDYYSEDPRNIIKNEDRHKMALKFVELFNKFNDSIMEIVKRFNLYKIEEAIEKCPNLTYFRKNTQQNRVYYKNVFYRFKAGIDYFEKHIASNDEIILTNINRTKKRISKIIGIINNGRNSADNNVSISKYTVEEFYKISSGLVTEISEFFNVMSNYNKKTAKVGLSDYLEILNPLQSLVSNAKYAFDIKKSFINTVDKVLFELNNLKSTIDEKEKEDEKEDKSFVKKIESLEGKLNNLQKKLTQAKNLEEVLKVRSIISKEISYFRLKLEEYATATKMKTGRDLSEEYPFISFHARLLYKYKAKEGEYRLTTIINSLDNIKEIFKSMPSKYFPDNLEKDIENLKSDLKLIILEINKGIRYNEYFAALSSIACAVSSLIKNAIKPLEREQNSQYCYKISQNARNLKRLIDSLKQTSSYLSELCK